jgi:DNA polymerase-3 subunit delta'
MRASVMTFLSQYAQDQARSAALSESGPKAATPWVNASDELRRLARDADTLYLDPKQTVLAALGLIEDAASPR